LSAGSDNSSAGQTASPTALDLSAASAGTFASTSAAAAPLAVRATSEFNRQSDARSVRARGAARIDHARTIDVSRVARSRPTQAPPAPPAFLREARAPASDAPPRGVADNQKKSLPPETPADTPALAPAPTTGNVVGAFEFAANPASPLKDQLPHFIAARANNLRPGNTNAAASPSAPGQHVVKELDIELTPEGLGAVSLKMRVNDGKLAIIMEVSSASALKAVQGEHAAIANSLGSSAQPLESLVIRQSEPSQSQGEKHDASNSERGTRRDERGDSGSASRQGQSAERREPRTAPTPIAPRRRSDSLLV
jgi:flagellar hook-length control protein FliK